MLNLLIQKLPPKPILKFYFLSLTHPFKFAIPIFVLFYHSRGLSFTQIGTIQSIYLASILLFETPTGYIGDRLGRKNSILTGRIIQTLFVLSHIFIETFVGFAVLWAIRGVSRTFISGSDSAWFYDTLNKQLDTEQYARISGRRHALRTGSDALTSFFGSILFGINQIYPWILGAALGLIGVAVVLTMTEPSTEDHEEGTLTIRRGISVTKRTLSKPELRLFIIYFTLLISIIASVKIYRQPFIINVLDLPPSSLGFFYAVYSTIKAIMNVLTGRINDHISIRQWFVFIPPAIGLGMATIIFSPPVAVVMFLIFGGSEEVSLTLGYQYINDLTGSFGRATVLSVTSMIRSAITIPFKIAAGVMADLFPLSLGLAIIGIALLTLSVFILSWRIPVLSAKHLEHM